MLIQYDAEWQVFVVATLNYGYLSHNLQDTPLDAQAQRSGHQPLFRASRGPKALPIIWKYRRLPYPICGLTGI